MSGIEKIKSVLENAEALVVGAGAGLSTSAGFTYSGERFEQYFSDFRARYGFSDMYTGGFYPYKTLEEHWAYWSRYITTNVEHCFQKAGFDKSRLFYTQGDYGLFQCSELVTRKLMITKSRFAQCMKRSRI